MATATAPHRLEAHAFTIEELLGRVERGAIRIPKFQRGLKWQTRDNERLLESVLRGYPIGTFLFYRDDAPAEPVVVGPRTLDAPVTRDALFVVDGQQRLTALFGSLTPPGPAPAVQREKFTFFYDLETGQIRHPTSRQEPPQSWVPLWALADSARLLRWLADRPELVAAPGVMSTLSEVAKTLQSYRVPVYVVGTSDRAVVSDIFDRINSFGKRLRKEEVFDALFGGQSGDEPGDLRSFADAVERLGFGRLPERLLLQVVMAVRDVDVTDDFRPHFRDPANLRTSIPTALAALGRVIDFVATDGRIPYVTFLPYQLPLIALARVFHGREHIHPRNRRLLVRWMWRGILTGIHRGESVPYIRQTLKAAHGDEDESVQALLALVGRQKPTYPPPGDRFRSRDAMTRARLVALARLGPANLETGEPIALDALLTRRDGLARLTAGEDGGLANRLLHPPVAEVDRLVRSARAQTLSSHALTEDMIAALRDGRTGSALEARAHHIETISARFWDDMAEWGENDRGPLERIRVGDDD